MTGADGTGAGLRVNLLGLFETKPALAETNQLPAKARALLAVLAAQNGRPMSRGKLAEMIWPLSGGDHAKQSLRQAIKSVRDAFAGIETFSVERDAAAGTIWLRGATSDVAQLAGLLEAPDEAAVAQIRALWRGPFLEDFPDISEPFESWLVEERARLTNRTSDVLLARAGTALAAGDAEAAIVASRDVVRIDALREDAHRLLMQAYAAAGRSSEALQQFEDLATLLRSELDVAPDPATVALAGQIKATAGRRPVPVVAAGSSPLPPASGEVPSAAAPSASVGSAPRARRPWLWGALAVAVIAVAGASLYHRFMPKPVPDARPVYTVASFKVTGEGDQGKALATALASRLANGISGIPNVRLMATPSEQQPAEFRVEGAISPGQGQTEVQAWVVNVKTGQAFGRTTFKAPPGEGTDVQTLTLGRIGDDLAVAINRNIYPPPDVTPDEKRARQLVQEARLRIDRKSADVLSTLDLFRQAQRLSPQDVEIASWFANALIAEGGSGRTSERDRDALYREATELIDGALKIAPYHRLALYARCQLLRQMSKPHAAVSACLESNKVLPWSARIHKEMGFIYIGLGDIASALLNFDAADSLERRLPVRWIWKYGAGLALLLAERYPEAQKMLRESITLHEDSFNAHLLLALACSRLGEADCVAASISQYRSQARQLNPQRVLDVILPAANPYSADIAPKVQRLKTEALKLIGEQI